MQLVWYNPSGIYFFKFSNRNTRTMCEICSKSMTGVYMRATLALNGLINSVNFWITNELVHIWWHKFWHWLIYRFIITYIPVSLSVITYVWLTYHFSHILHNFWFMDWLTIWLTNLIIESKLVVSFVSFNSFRRVFRTLPTSRIERFAKIVNGWKPLTIFAKRSVLDVWHGCNHAFEFTNWLIGQYADILFICYNFSWMPERALR